MSTQWMMFIRCYNVLHKQFITEALSTFFCLCVYFLGQCVGCIQIMFENYLNSIQKYTERASF